LTEEKSMPALGGILLLGGLAIVAYDGLASVLATWLRFKYTYASLGSFLIYAITGYFAARVADQSSALFAGAVLGVVDATLGWSISWSLGQGRLANITIGRWFGTAILVSALATAIAGLGGLVGYGT
jgi:hypothetical protein